MKLRFRDTKTLWIVAALLAIAAVIQGCARNEHSETSHHDEEHAGHGQEGPHGGRLFEAGDYQLELLLSGDDGPPAFTAYVLGANGRAQSVDGTSLSLVLERFGGRRDTVRFRIDGDHFHSTEPIAEPHSFAAKVTFQRGGKVYRWQFEQREGRIELPSEAVRSSGIETGLAGPAQIEVTIESPGEVRLNSERVVHVRPRFPGQVQELRKRLGDAVRRGEVLALVHSNESLADYAIEAPMSGTVVGQEVAVGQAVDHESVLYTVADLSSVWVDFPIYPQNAGRIRLGQRVHAQSVSGPPIAGTGRVRYVGPLLEQDTRVSYGRVVLDNRNRQWQPGLYVTCAVAIENVSVPVAVPDEAIVRLREGPAVFRADTTVFEPQPVVVGRSDGRTTEIVEGLEPGARIVVRKAFLLKAELGKGEAGHEH